MIDLHGAPGSQNGNDHSGRSGNGIHWNTPANINRCVTPCAISQPIPSSVWPTRSTIYDLTLIADRANAVNANATTAGVISGIEMLNEPSTTYVGGPITMQQLFDFYSRAYTAIRATGFNGDIWVLLHPHMSCPSVWLMLLRSGRCTTAGGMKTLDGRVSWRRPLHMTCTLTRTSTTALGAPSSSPRLGATCSTRATSHGR